jgi:hypothetical protein
MQRPLDWRPVRIARLTGDASSELPPKILGAHIDQLLKDRAKLRAAARSISGEREQAEAAGGPTRTERLMGQRPPQASVNLADRQLAAVCHALDGNERELVRILGEQQRALSASLHSRTQDARSEALELLDQASRAILQFSELSALQRWLENPLQPDGQSLRPFVVQPLHVHAPHPTSNKSLTVSAAIDIIGERLEDGSVDAQLKRRRAGARASTVGTSPGERL